MATLVREDLIIDVGMHVGHDTWFYLAKGFSVVAVEANPQLVATAEAEFSDAIAEGRLQIFGVAIAERAGVVPFAVADRSGFSTLSDAEVKRAEARGVHFRRVEVPAVPFEEILEQVGIPHYLKVDIEGLDWLCVRALHSFRDRPPFISIESNIKNAEPRLGLDRIRDELVQLRRLGYRRFKYVNQMRVRPLPDPPLEGSRFVQPVASVNASGAFGKETPGRWEPVWSALARGSALRIMHELGARDGRLARLPPGQVYRRLVGRGGERREPRDGAPSHEPCGGQRPAAAAPKSRYRRLRTRVLQLPAGSFDLHARLG